MSPVVLLFVSSLALSSAATAPVRCEDSVEAADAPRAAVVSVSHRSYVLATIPAGAIRLPRGTYRFAAEAPHSFPFVADVDVTAERKTLAVQLRPSRSIDGIVRDGANGAPIAGASVTADGGGEATTTRNGRFALQVDPEKWPKELVVRAAGYGTRTIAVPPARVNTSLDDILLRRGAAVAADIHQTEPGQLVAVELIELRNDGRTPGRPVQRHELPKSDALTRRVRFEDVKPGSYVVLAVGSGPAMRAGERIDVQQSDPPPLHVQIAPFPLRLRTRSDGKPLPGARVILRHHQAFWEVPLRAGESGEATVELWQTGRLSATVEPAAAVPYRLRNEIVEAKETEWVLEMPQFEVVGTVIDAESGAPVPNAGVALTMRSADRYHMAVSTVADQDGAFRFAPVFPGEHRLQAAAPKYPPAEVAYSFGEEEESHAVTIALARMPMTMLTVVDARGKPIAAADVFVHRGAMQIARGRTDAAGRAPLFILAGEARDLFVVPRDGSLGVAHVASGQPELRLPLPDGASRIVVRMESESHEPIPRLTVDVRYNGVLLPFEVMQALAGRGSRTSSDAEGRIVLEHMPPGVYELWPVGAPPASGGAPLRLVAVPGENVAVMTFARAGRSR